MFCFDSATGHLADMFFARFLRESPGGPASGLSAGAGAGGAEGEEPGNGALVGGEQVRDLAQGALMELLQSSADAESPLKVHLGA